MIKFNEIVYDSRQVKKGDLFCAVKGLTVDGNDFVKSAIENGAVAVLSENEKPKDLDVKWIKCDNVKQEAAKIAKEFYAVNFDEIFSAAVTGTNGKTSIATIIYEISSQIYGEEHSCLTGTIANKVCKELIEASRTTPEAIDTLKILGTAKNKIKALSMEASSHALVLDRLSGFTFDLAIFSNLTQDHLDFHKTMEEYYQAKKTLFTRHLKVDGITIINIDDKYGKRLFDELSGNRKYSVGFNDEADYKISQVHCDRTSSFFKIKTVEGKTLKFRTRLIGNFNVINCAQAVCGLLACGFNEDTIIDGLANIKPVEGRIDKVEIDAGFAVFVDYAHTPDALVKVLTTAKKLTKAKLIVVFGAGGGRDKSKRPLMADAVAKNCDFAVLTSDNPRNEDPQSIINDTKTGFPLDFPYKSIPDRREAINFALNYAKSDDTIIIAGKGHEKYQEIGGVRHYFDDKETVRELWQSGFLGDRENAALWAE
jgi:UDP-N-acetylmuramoyl-L-alanyl-D-glutamate--2,6-diaminopimelate ligase